MIRKLAHLCLVTDQLEPMREFYTQKLGLSVQFVFHHTDGGTFGYYLCCGDTTFIEIFDRAGKTKQWGHDGGPLRAGNQMNHLCFEVTGLKELHTMLIARGVKIGEIMTGMDSSLQAWTGDPDGNAIEFMEYTHASWQLQPPAMNVTPLK